LTAVENFEEVYFFGVPQNQWWDSTQVAAHPWPMRTPFETPSASPASGADVVVVGARLAPKVAVPRAEADVGCGVLWDAPRALACDSAPAD